MTTFYITQDVLTNQENGGIFFSCLNQYLDEKDQRNVLGSSKNVYLCMVLFKSKLESAHINSFLNKPLLKDNKKFLNLQISEFTFRVYNNFKSIEGLNMAIMRKLVDIFNEIKNLNQERIKDLKKESLHWKYANIFNFLHLKPIILENTCNSANIQLLSVPFFTTVQKITLYKKVFDGYLRTFKNRKTIKKLANMVNDKRLLREYFLLKAENYTSQNKAELLTYV
jgi:hypothetical protein